MERGINVTETHFDKIILLETPKNICTKLIMQEKW